MRTADHLSLPALLLPLLMIAACSDDSTDQAAIQPSATPDAVAAASAEALSEPTAAPVAAIESHYTSLGACREVERVEEGAFGRSACEAPGGIILEYVTADGRDDLRIGTSARGTVNLGLPALGKGAFNALGPVIEWRGQAGPAGFVPDALIVRDRIHDIPDRPERARSMLAVVNLDRKCVVAMVAPGQRQNEAAREAAAAGGDCLTIR